jgi:hypothetical protein
MNIKELALLLQDNDNIKLICVNEENIDENYGNINFYGNKISFDGDLTDEVKLFWVQFAIPESYKYQQIEENKVKEEMNKFVQFTQGDWDGIEECDGEQIYYCCLKIK